MKKKSAKPFPNHHPSPLLPPRPLPTPQDPNIKNMAEQIAKDPSFAQMTQRLQASVKAGPDGGVQMDQGQYMSAMQDVMSNPNFMGIAEKLGNALMQVNTSIPQHVAARPPLSSFPLISSSFSSYPYLPFSSSPFLDTSVILFFYWSRERRS